MRCTERCIKPGEKFNFSAVGIDLCQLTFSMQADMNRYSLLFEIIMHAEGEYGGLGGGRGNNYIFFVTSEMRSLRI